MKKSKVKYIFFDFDGTIFDGRRIVFSSLLEFFDRIEYKFSKKKVKQLMGSKIKNMLHELGLHDEYESFRENFAKILLKNSKKKNVKPCVSLEPLKRLHKGGIRFVIITNNYQGYVKEVLSVLKISKLFDEVYSTEDLEMTKRDVIELLVCESNLNLDEVVYVGDRYSDIVESREAGIITVAIHNKSSWSSLSEILSESPDYIISDFQDLEKILS